MVSHLSLDLQEQLDDSLHLEFLKVGQVVASEPLNKAVLTHDGQCQLDVEEEGVLDIQPIIIEVLGKALGHNVLGLERLDHALV